MSVHGSRHPVLVDVAACYARIRADLEPHMLKEERFLFPMIRELAASTGLASFHCGSLRNPISVMLSEYDAVGDLVAKLRQLTNGYTQPVDGCASYATCFAAMAEIEADTRLHIHEENNVLFPLVVRLEAERTGMGSRMIGSANPTGGCDSGDPPCWSHLLDDQRGDIANRHDIERLVRDFYRYAAMDDLLGPVFEAAHVNGTLTSQPWSTSGPGNSWVTRDTKASATRPRVSRRADPAVGLAIQTVDRNVLRHRRYVVPRAWRADHQRQRTQEGCRYGATACWRVRQRNGTDRSDSAARRDEGR